MRSSSTLTTLDYKLLGLVDFITVKLLILFDKCHSHSRYKIYSPIHSNIY